MSSNLQFSHRLDSAQLVMYNRLIVCHLSHPCISTCMLIISTACCCGITGSLPLKVSNDLPVPDCH